MILDKSEKFWKPEKDIATETVTIKEEQKDIKKPSFVVAMLPIAVPIIMIIINTVANSVLGDAEPEVFVAYMIAVRSMGQKAAEKAATDSLSSAGIVFLITGAGGAFSNIITVTGVSDAISDIVSGLTTNVFVVIILAYLVGLLIKQVTGSGTVSAITSMTIMSSVAPAVALPPVFIAMACLSGTLFGATVNDSGFWIVTNMSGLEFTGGVKTYTIPEMIESVIYLAIMLIITAGYVMIF